MLVTPACPASRLLSVLPLPPHSFKFLLNPRDGLHGSDNASCETLTYAVWVGSKMNDKDLALVATATAFVSRDSPDFPPRTLPL